MGSPPLVGGDITPVSTPKQLTASQPGFMERDPTGLGRPPCAPHTGPLFWGWGGGPAMASCSTRALSPQCPHWRVWVQGPGLHLFLPLEEA